MYIVAILLLYTPPLPSFLFVALSSERDIMYLHTRLIGEFHRLVRYVSCTHSQRKTGFLLFKKKKNKKRVSLSLSLSIVGSIIIRLIVDKRSRLCTCSFRLYIPIAVFRASFISTLPQCFSNLLEGFRFY